MELRSRSRSATPQRLTENHESDRVLRSGKLRSVAEVEEETVTVKTTNTTHKITKVGSETITENGSLAHDLSHTENNVNHALEYKLQSKTVSSSSDDFIALKMYRDAKEYWNLYPKTDYTYSPNSKDRVELAPGVVNMPNMSRRPIHGDDSVDFVHKETTTRMAPRALFGNSSNNNHEYIYKESKYSSKYTSTRTEISFFRRIFYSVFYVIYMSTRPFMLIHDVASEAVSRAHQFVCNVMLIDTWLLRGATASTFTKSPSNKASFTRDEVHKQHNKLVQLLALCIVPLLVLGGLHVLLGTNFFVPSTLHEL